MGFSAILPPMPRYWLYSLALILLAQPALGVVIDDFTEGPVSLTDELGFGSVSDLKLGLDPSHVAAGARYVTFNAIGQPSGGSDTVTVEVDPNGTGSFRQSPAPNLSAANLFVIYGDTSFGLPPMTLDLLANNADRLSIAFNHTIPNADPYADFALGVFLFSDNAGFYTWVRLPSSDGPFVLDIPYDDVLSSSPNLDLSAITKMRFGTSNGTMQGHFEISEVYTSGSPLPGDFNRDGVVDGNDVSSWEQTYGRLVQSPSYFGYLSTDTNRDSSVDGMDFLSWQANVGATQVSASVPEPASLSLALIPLALLYRRPSSRDHLAGDINSWPLRQRRSREGLNAT